MPQRHKPTPTNRNPNHPSGRILPATRPETSQHNNRKTPTKRPTPILPDTFTPEDLLACSLLSADIKANGIVEILIENPDKYSKLLEDIDESLEFISFNSEV